MKKFFSLFAAVLFAGSMMADSYTISFKESGTESDSGTGLTSTTVADYVATGAEYVSAVAPSGKVYNARTGRGLKFGNSSNPGAVTLTLATPVNVTSIVVSAMQYKDGESSLKIQDKTDYVTTADLADYTYTYATATEVSEITVGTATKRGYVKSVTVNYEAGGVTPPATLTEPAAAPAAPTWPANQVKAVYSETYSADCGFGEWGSSTQYSQDTYGKKYVTAGGGYFGLTFEGDAALNCSKMEKLHLDIWIAEDASVGIVPIHGGTEVRVTKNLVGQQWNAIDIALTEFEGVTNWTNVYQIKLDNISNKTFWVNNVYFYTTVAPAADAEAPQNVTASLVSASYFSAKITATATDNSDAVKFFVMNGETELAAANAVSGVAKEINVNGLLPNTAYNLSVVAKDEAGNAAAPVAVAASTLAAPAPATAPTYAADKVLAIFADGYTNKLTEIQDWWSMPAVTPGQLTETSKALCIDPTGTPVGGCFGLAFAAVDASAFDALEMDVFATTENSVLKIQAIGIGEATTYNLVANQWNHISLNIKDNTKADLQQVGFYDCGNLTGVCFVQNVLFVDTDEPVALPDPTNCAEAREAALSVSANNELYKDGAVYSITGYVTSIQTAYSDQHHNISFWMADAADGGQVLQAYRAACASADEAPIVGDKVTVTGSLTKYNSTPEFAAACTFVIVEHGTPVVPQNLGEKTIAEFLTLANTVDTCVLTGVVTNIVNDTYGNLYLADGNDTLYVYGVLTPAGEAKKFGELNVAVNDTLTVKAVYSLYNNAPQAKNAVFVAVKKAPVVAQDIEITMSTGLQWTDAVAAEGWWQIMGQNETYMFSLSNVSTTEAAGVYTVADLDADYSYITIMTATDTVDVAFVDGSITVAVAADGAITITGTLVGSDGNNYIFNLTYKDPVAETTVNVQIAEWALADTYLQYGLFAVGGTAADKTYVQLALWMADGQEDIYGDYTEEDFDHQYIGTGLIDATGATQSIFSATIHIEEIGEAIAVTADLLCYNNTLYKVTTLTQGIDNVDAAVKAIKSIVNGQVVIEKAGKTYNMNGTVIR